MKKSVLLTLIAAFLCVNLTAQPFNQKEPPERPDFTNKARPDFEQKKEIQYKATFVVDNEEIVIENQEIVSDKANELCVLVKNGGKATFRNCTFIKTGSPEIKSQRPDNPPPEMDRDFDKMMPPPSDNGMGMKKLDVKMPNDGKRPEMKQMPGNEDDNYNFYGINSAVLATGEGSIIILEDCTVKTDAEFANAIFATNKASIQIKNIIITTKQNSSRGLFATMAGKINAEGIISIKTTGAHCAALATDRGGGDVIVKGISTAKCYVQTFGDGSPCIYSTGNIIAENLRGDAEMSQAIVIEGKNLVSVSDSILSGKDKNYGGIMLYQSTSGDAAEGTCELKLKNTTIQDKGTASMFLVTNTEAELHLENCIFLNAEGNKLKAKDIFILCKNCNTKQRQWGKEGSNGGKAYFYFKNQSVEGIACATENESVIKIVESDNSQINLKKHKGKGKCNL